MPLVVPISISAESRKLRTHIPDMSCLFESGRLQIDAAMPSSPGMCRMLSCVCALAPGQYCQIGRTSITAGMPPAGISCFRPEPCYIGSAPALKTHPWGPGRPRLQAVQFEAFPFCACPAGCRRSVHAFIRAVPAAPRRGGRLRCCPAGRGRCRHHEAAPTPGRSRCRYRE